MLQDEGRFFLHFPSKSIKMEDSRRNILLLYAAFLGKSIKREDWRRNISLPYTAFLGQKCSGR